MAEAITRGGREVADLDDAEFLRLAGAHERHYMTELPCPSWCRYEQGHVFEGEYNDGRQYRFHSLYLDTPKGVEHLAITQEETRRDEDDATVQRSSAYIAFTGDGDGDGDGDGGADDARQMASALLHAADKLEGLGA